MPSVCECPACHHKMKIPDGVDGNVNCPKCGNSFSIDAAKQVQGVPEWFAEMLGEPAEAPAAEPVTDLMPTTLTPVEQVASQHPLVTINVGGGLGLQGGGVSAWLEPDRGTAILVIGVVSLFTMPLPLGLLAWIWANEDLAKMDAGIMNPGGRGTTQAGKVLGVLTTLTAVISLIAACVMFVFFFGLCGAIAGGAAGKATGH
jgi:hypothetical protein